MVPNPYHMLPGALVWWEVCDGLAGPAALGSSMAAGAACQP
jgi:hypothetical protein